MTNWQESPGGLVGSGGIRAGLMSVPPVAVGESYDLSKNSGVIRVKSADICLSGTIEYAKAKKKARRGLFAGKLATGSSVA